MRLLVDARSARTHAGRYVIEGLARAWAVDERVEAVRVVGDDVTLDLPDEVSRESSTASGWIAHLGGEIPRLAREWSADLVFIPNGTPPRDTPCVLYFQDLFHFRPFEVVREGAGKLVREGLRELWTRANRGAVALGVAVSSEIAREASKRFRVPVHTIPNGVDVPYGWTGAVDEIVILGGMGVRKNEALAVRAWANVPAARRAATRLHIIGAEPRSKQAELRQLASMLGVADSVVVDGSLPRDRYLHHIAEGRLAVSCSRLESFGLPVAEALLMGAPLLCTRIPSHVELLERAGAGRPFATHDVWQLASLIGAALDGKSPPRLTEAPTGWDWTTRAREHVDAYARYLESDGAANAAETHVRH